MNRGGSPWTTFLSYSVEVCNFDSFDVRLDSADSW